MDIVMMAERVASFAHKDQVDKAGQPYIEHPRRVAVNTIAALWVTEDLDLKFADKVVATAWLHDVLEDTSVPEFVLRGMFPKDVVDAVKILTHTKGEPNEVYWMRITTNEIARLVKLADIKDNTDPLRMARLDGPTRERLQEKYTRALEILHTP